MSRRAGMQGCPAARPSEARAASPPDEIALVESGSRGLPALLGSVALAPRDRVFVAWGEWGGSLATLAGPDGISVEPMPTDDRGNLDLGAARATADRRVRLVLPTWCPATDGTAAPAAEVGLLAREIGATWSGGAWRPRPDAGRFETGKVYQGAPPMPRPVRTPTVRRSIAGVSASGAAARSRA